MGFNYEASIYLTKISTAVLSLSNMTGCDLKPEAVRKIVITMQELEQSTADFIIEMGISAAGAKVCRETFIHANKTAIRHLEKIQLQGKFNFGELPKSLKLENETLIKELTFN
ncbi:MAG: hypothetical protein NC485_13860 [Ruminococcus flavefaciens]|nr:hypothetical protein [Ruminococcus flavefaciens]